MTEQLKLPQFTKAKYSCPEFMAETLIDRRNERVRVLKYLVTDKPAFSRYLKYLADSHGAGKIILYASEKDWREMLQFGYRLEGVMSGYFRGSPAFCLAFYPDQLRSSSRNILEEDSILKDIAESGRRRKKEQGSNDNRLGSDSNAPDSTYTIRTAQEADVDAIVRVFSQAFSTYPSPVEDRAYLKKMISGQSNIVKVAESNGKLAGIISADLDRPTQSAEITDCVITPGHRGRGLMGRLLDVLEEELDSRLYLYSLTRAGVPQINFLFHSRGYRYAGKLINNCSMCGTFENMNIWEKPQKQSIVPGAQNA